MRRRPSSALLAIGLAACAHAKGAAATVPDVQFQPIPVPTRIAGGDRLALGPHGATMILAGGAVYDLADGSPLRAPGAISDVAFTGDGMLWAVSGDHLGAYDGRHFEMSIQLPHAGYTLAGASRRLFLIGPTDEGGSEVLVLEKGRGYRKLFQVDGTIDAASAVDDGLVFVSDEVVYHYTVDPAHLEAVMATFDKAATSGVCVDAAGPYIIVASGDHLYATDGTHVASFHIAGMSAMRCNGGDVYVLSGGAPPSLLWSEKLGARSFPHAHAASKRPAAP